MVALNRTNNGVVEWNRHHHEMIKKYKSHIITGSNQHHASSGYYYTYGNKDNYGMLGKSSISSYSTKKCEIQSQLRGACITEMSQMDLELGIKELSKYLPTLPSIISPIVTVAHEMQETEGNINLKEMTSSKSGLWKSNICVNAGTAEFHVESDCTYTLIHVPRQSYPRKADKYLFIFKLSEQCHVSIPMVIGTSILFSGQFLCHRQSQPHTSVIGDDVFINFLSYGNLRLFRHIENSFDIVKHDKQFIITLNT